MPVSYEIRPEQHQVRVSFEAPVNDRAILDGLSQAANEPEVTRGFRFLIDVRRSGYTPNRASVQIFVNFHVNHPILRHCPTAIVTEELVDFGVSNMFAMLCELHNAQVRAFRSLDEAEAWFDDLKKNTLYEI